MVDREDYLPVAILVLLGAIGIAVPVILYGLGMKVLALIFAIVWWAIPGLPVPILHDFSRGWQPFFVAYPVGLAMFFWEPVK